MCHLYVRERDEEDSPEIPPATRRTTPTGRTFLREASGSEHRVAEAVEGEDTSKCRIDQRTHVVMEKGLEGDDEVVDQECRRTSLKPRRRLVVDSVWMKEAGGINLAAMG